MKLSSVLFILPPVLLLMLAVVYLVLGWGSADEAPIGIHGIIAMVLGVVLTLALAGLLIWLMHFSSRNEYDQ